MLRTQSTDEFRITIIIFINTIQRLVHYLTSVKQVAIYETETVFLTLKKLFTAKT